MKLATTTADLRSYAKTPAETVKLFAGTGFKLLDMNFYLENYSDSPFVVPGDDWKKLVGDAGEAAAKIGIGFCQAHSPDGEHYILGENRDNLLTATKRTIEACAMLGIKDTVIHAGISAAFTPCEFMKRNRDFYSELFDTSEKYEVNLLVENGCEINSPGYYLRTGAEMKEFLEEASAKYDLVILDAPPVLAVSESTVIASQADGTLLVVWSGRTSRKLLTAAVRQLLSRGADLLGCVLNNLDLTRMGNYGASSYYHYYGYDYRYEEDNSSTPAKPNSAES